MYKKSSHNLTSRADHASYTNRKNEHGIDPTTFNNPLAPPPSETTVDSVVDERAILIARKQDIEARLSKLNAMLADSKMRRLSNWDQMAHWERERGTLNQEKRDIEQKFAKLKMKMRAINIEANNKEKQTFERAFMIVAKELLAEPIYNRIVIATIHRVGDGVSSGEI